MSQLSKVIFAFAGVFVAGAVAGGIVALRVGGQQVVQPSPTQPPAPRVVTVDNFATAQFGRYEQQLGLTADQKIQIMPIIQAANKKIFDLSQETRARTLEMRAELDKEVSAFLTVEQRDKLAKLTKQRADEFARRANRPGFGSGHDGLRGEPGFGNPGRRGDSPGLESTTDSSGQPTPPSTPGGT
jgi:Spy/CpxP family protein refolding chaperone